MRRVTSFLRRGREDQRGATILEFAFVLPTLCLLLVGGMDLGHMLYMQSSLEGIVQRAGRNSALESGIATANQTALDNMVRNHIRHLHNTATVSFSREAFSNYVQAQRRGEEYTDTNANGTCDAGEPYIEANGVAGWQANMSRSGQGNAKDAVVYRVTVAYPAILPLWKMIGGTENIELQATTVLRNQPYGEQATVTPTPGNCT